MADPLSTAGLVLQVADLLKKLYEYGKAVKAAQRDILGLRNELYALKGVLQDIEDGQDAAGSRPSRRELVEAMESAHMLLNVLTDKLRKRSSGPGRALQTLTWPFDKAAYNDMFTRLERLKSWFQLYLMGDQREAVSSLRDELRDLTVVVQDDVAERKFKGQTDAQRELLAKLAPASPDAEHAKACCTWQGTDSGKWFLEGHLRDWLSSGDSHPPLMLLTGKSGSGKTTLLSRAAEESHQYVGTINSIIVAKFYCSYNDATSQQVKSILGSWLAQIGESVPSIIDSLDHKKLKRGTLPVADLEQCIATAATKCLLLLIVDALNESSEHREICKSLIRISATSANVKCLVSTTPTFSGFAEAAQKVQRVDMQAGALRPDMEAYIDLEVTKHAVLRSVTREKLVDTLLPKSNGMFRWLGCQLQYLSSQPTTKLALRALTKLPATLDDTYRAILLRVPQASRGLVKEALIWLTHSHRPLTLLEINEAVVLEEEDGDVDESCRLRPDDLLLSLCQGLVDWDPQTSVVTLSHYSVWTFLTSTSIRDTDAAFFALYEEECMKSITRKCITYLLMKPFHIGVCGPQKLWKLSEDYPFLDYASERWPLHAFKARCGSDELDLIIKLFLTHQSRPNGGSFTFWTYCLFPESGGDIARNAEPLYYAASYGLSDVVRTLLDQELIVNRRDGRNWYIDHKCGRNLSTALKVAGFRGYPKIVQLLLAAGADPKSTDVIGMPCLYWAETSDGLEYEACAQLLREHISRLSRDRTTITKDTSRKRPTHERCLKGRSLSHERYYCSGCGAWPTDLQADGACTPEGGYSWVGTQLPYFGTKECVATLLGKKHTAR